MWFSFPFRNNWCENENINSFLFNPLSGPYTCKQFVQTECLHKHFDSVGCCLHAGANCLCEIKSSLIFFAQAANACAIWVLACTNRRQLVLFGVDTVWLCQLSLFVAGAYPGIGQGGGGRHFWKFSSRVAKMSISISLAYSHGEVYIRMLLAYSVFLWTYRETIQMSPTVQCTLIWWYTKSNISYLEWEN